MAKGKVGDATCTVKVKAEDYAKVVSGKMRPEKAFMEGKISASNLSDMMKFGQAFDMKKAREIAEKERAAGGGSAAASPASSAEPAARPDGLNRDYLGRRFSGEPVWLSGDGARAYALATNDENSAYLDDARPGGVVAPPLYPVRLFKDLLFTAMTDDDLGADLLRLVHGEQDMRFHRPLRPGDLCTLRAWVDGIEDKSSGQLLSIGQNMFVDGQLAVETMTRLFIRSKSKKKADQSKGAADKDAESLGEPSFSAPMQVTDDQSMRYAEASGDNNPIHVDETVAKLAGFPTVILQGLCTMAFTSQAVVRNVADGVPERLKRLKVRFAKPVLPSDALITEGWVQESNGGSTVVNFRTRNQDGVDVIVNGVAEVATD